MKKLIITIIAVLIVVLGAVYLLKMYMTGDKIEIASADEAIIFIKEKNSELRNYPSDNLPPKRIETKQAQNGWYLGFYTEGSGLPGILRATCYLVTTSGNITATGEFSAGGKSGPSSLDLSTCKSAITSRY
ncbi:YdgA family protein [Candidatus Parcubacteria bacterium]|nr:YdgA family protein [Candidatus Parcubacteria bacterium]